MNLKPNTSFQDAQSNKMTCKAYRPNSKVIERRNSEKNERRKAIFRTLVHSVTTHESFITNMSQSGFLVIVEGDNNLTVFTHKFLGNGL